MFYLLLRCVFLIQFVESFDFSTIIGDIGEPPMYVDEKWIKSPKLENNQIYLFVQDSDPMTWYEADDYCGRHGAFLAEPFSIEEIDFLRDQANRLPVTNWWIGLRQFEKCKCTSLGPSQTSIFSFANPDSLQWRINNGLGSTSCPSKYQKLCSGYEWRWGISGQRLLYTYWNTNEPNDIDNEHCVAMWVKSDNQRWANWRCDTKIDGDKHHRWRQKSNWSFKPICQKAADDYQYLFECFWEL